MMETQQNPLKKEIKVLDWIVFVTFLLMILARVLTIGVMSYTSETTGADITAVFQVYEANPIAKMFDSLKGIQTMLVFILMPAAVIAMYVYFRRKVFKGKMELDQLIMFTTFLFLVIIMDVINNATIMVARML